MSFTGVFGFVILIIIAIALLGPSKLPRGIEQLWLMLTNFRRSQAELEPLLHPVRVNEIVNGKRVCGQ